MKKKTKIITLLIASSFFSLTGTTVKAQIPGVSLVNGVIKKVIVAIDLKVQQLQNQTLALQNAEQQLENSLHLSSLNNISGWLENEKDLYASYYQELNQVRGLIADSDTVKSVISKQKQLVTEYQQAGALFKQDAHFSAAELRYMGTIYNGILQESLRNLDQLLMVVSDPVPKWMMPNACKRSGRRPGLCKPIWTTCASLTGRTPACACCALKMRRTGSRSNSFMACSKQKGKRRKLKDTQ